MDLPEDTSVKTFASGVGGIEFKSRADQISHMLPMTCHHCNFDVWPWFKAAEMGIAHS